MKAILAATLLAAVATLPSAASAHDGYGHYGYASGHFDYHPGHLDAHGDHYDYHPGHYDYHRPAVSFRSYSAYSPTYGYSGLGYSGFRSYGYGNGYGYGSYCH